MEDDLDPFDSEQPLDEDEREALQQDLIDVQTLKELLSPRGIKGAVFYCPDCNEDHYLAWDLLTGNLKELLSAGESPIHEPAFDPDPDEYVGWDYARGFLDGYESFEQEELGEVADRLVSVLASRGWQPADVRSLLAHVGLDIDIRDPGGAREDGNEG
jgi:hypothetical protein